MLCTILPTTMPGRLWPGINSVSKSGFTRLATAKVLSGMRINPLAAANTLSRIRFNTLADDNTLSGIQNCLLAAANDMPAQPDNTSTSHQITIEIIHPLASIGKHGNQGDKATFDQAKKPFSNRTANKIIRASFSIVSV